jgi:hypothetical protein
MATETGEAERLLEQLAAHLLADPTVRQGTGFGSSPGLRVGSKTFAMLRGSELVVKLPRQRVDELVASGTATRFDPRHDGRLMKEWATIPLRHSSDWEQLAGEALRFVRSASPGPKRR